MPRIKGLMSTGSRKSMMRAMQKKPAKTMARTTASRHGKGGTGAPTEWRHAGTATTDRASARPTGKKRGRRRTPDCSQGGEEPLREKSHYAHHAPVHGANRANGARGAAGAGVPPCIRDGRAQSATAGERHTGGQGHESRNIGKHRRRAAPARQATTFEQWSDALG
jgi:hypothetical protein